jgi:hypothetical protein
VGDLQQICTLVGSMFYHNEMRFKEWRDKFKRTLNSNLNMSQVYKPWSSSSKMKQ